MRNFIIANDAYKLNLKILILEILIYKTFIQ